MWPPYRDRKALHAAVRRTHGFLLPVRILVTDDDADALASMCDVLRSALPGVEVLGARSAHQALASLQQERPDVVVADYKMPRMDGLRLVEELRRAAPLLPIVMVTAFAGPDVDSAVAAGQVRTVLRKPFGAAELVNAVRDALGDLVGPAPAA
jgi:CheY-like chemotaxis protein